ncbi:MAG: response regulator transcription factor [Bacteroidota bacterium]
MKNLAKILVVEDEELTSRMIEFVLKKNNYSIIKAEDGGKAIELFDQEQPDLVITDIMLPFRSGMEVAHHIKTNSPKTPVIVLSSLGDEETTVEEAFKLNVDDFIGKPFSPNELLLRIKRLLR